MKKYYLPTLLSLPVAALLCTPNAFADSFSVAYLAPGVQTPSSGSYETFGTSAVSNGPNTYSSPLTGTYTGTFQISAADSYGGAGGAGDYLQVFGGNKATLSIGKEVNFFGLWFSALDSGNSLSFYDGGTVPVFTFNAAQFGAAVGACNGSNPYCGNPNNGADGGEQFAYINFLDTTGTFSSVVFSQAVNGGAFESDNHQVMAGVKSITGTPLGATPEPSSLMLLGTGITALAGVVRRKR